MAIEVFPVVHVHDIEQAQEQSAAAFEAGADGVYLIDHGDSQTDTLIGAFNVVSAAWANRFIGLNFLQFSSSAEALSFLRTSLQDDEIAGLPTGLWVDNAYTEKNKCMQLRESDNALSSISYLGGVAFKYTSTYTDEPQAAASEARALAPFVDVVTTSGKGTGSPPSPEKIRAMKRTIGTQKLAVASGISLENIADYEGSFDQLLVSTSIETEPYSGIFNPQRMSELIGVAHEL